MNNHTYERNSRVQIREVGDDLFLVGEDDETIYHLNAVGRAVWTVLKAPETETAIVELLAAAFRDTPPKIIQADVHALLEQLQARDLVIVSDDTRA